MYFLQLRCWATILRGEVDFNVLRKDVMFNIILFTPYRNLDVLHMHNS